MKAKTWRRGGNFGKMLVTPPKELRGIRLHLVPIWPIHQHRCACEQVCGGETTPLCENSNCADAALLPFPLCGWTRSDMSSAVPRLPTERMSGTPRSSLGAAAKIQAVLRGDESVNLPSDTIHHCSDMIRPRHLGIQPPRPTPPWRRMAAGKAFLRGLQSAPRSLLACGRHNWHAPPIQKPLGRHPSPPPPFPHYRVLPPKEADTFGLMADPNGGSH